MTAEERHALINRMPIIMVPRCCDDPEVMEYLETLFLEFRDVRKPLTADQMLDLAHRRFGDRADSVDFWIN